MSVETCNDHHVCRNGSRCTPHPNYAGSYTCDCDTITEDNAVYAGLSCEHMASAFCNPDNAPNTDSFCTNGGVCVKDIDDMGVHYGCQCPDGYKGDVRER